MTIIPEEFLPKVSVLDDGDENEVVTTDILFQTTDDHLSSHNYEYDEYNKNNDKWIEQVTIEGLTYQLLLPPDIGTLFAHRVWSGSKLLSSYLIQNAQTLIHSKRTIEFGSGTALPSLVALTHGSRFSLITDYPDENVLGALRETVGMNWDVIHGDASKVLVAGYEWGTDVQDILKQSSSRIGLGATPVDDCSNHHISQDLIDYKTEETSKDFYFDVAILSECIWMHRTHDALAKSINLVLHPIHGVAILTYAHHVPGKEKEDDHFFDICSEKYGFSVEHVQTESMSYMWDAEKTIDIYLKVLRRTQV